MKRLVFLVLAGFLLIAMSTLGLAQEAAQFDEMPYVGIILNKTNRDISFPSANSGGTLIVPARGNLEYITWAKNFQLIGYVNGQPYYCQQIDVKPKGYPLMCKNYDFVAEVVSTEKPERKYKPVRKKKRLKKRTAEG